MNINEAIDAALRNVASHGDTDIFPFPFENLAFKDRPAEARLVLQAIYGNVQNWISSYKPEKISTLTQVGYTGFRWATLIDPFWNAYYLALVISIADQIESKRLSESKEVVYSYRYHWDDAEAKLFKDST